MNLPLVYLLNTTDYALLMRNILSILKHNLFIITNAYFTSFYIHNHN